MAINLTDFDKIWASSSPLTPYSFTDANYQEGWNFVGSTPPARQMWDFLQKNNDEKAQFLADAMFKGNPLTFTADDGNGNTVSLLGNPNGSLTWNGKEVERVNAMDLDNPGYIRFESGLQICWGSEPSVANTNVTITFPAPFSGVPRVTLSAGSYSVTYGWTNISSSIVVVRTSSTSGVIVYFMAIGKWK